MAHGNRVHEVPKIIYKDWDRISNNKGSITQWIISCMQHEKSIADKNKKSCEEFHNRLRNS